MLRDRRTPFFIIEEHHEAFFVWHYAILNQLIRAKNNCLLHVDEHSDLGTPRFNVSINDLNGELALIRDFTYNELNIASFIMPCVYKGVFNKVFWIRQNHKKPSKRALKRYIRSYNQAGKNLISGKLQDLKQDIEDVDRKEFNLYLRTIQQIPLNLSVILDIDLDYFSSVDDPNVVRRTAIEITREEYDRFRNSRYHELQLSCIGRIDTARKGRKYYYLLNDYREILPSKLKVDRNKIEERIGVFLNALETKKVKPSIVDICRSRYSGYTPEDQWQFIENRLLDGLKQLYDFEPIHIDKIMQY